MTKLFEPTLFLRDGKEWIKGFTMERPDDEPLKYKKHSEGLSWHDYLMKQFEADAAVEYPVCEGSRFLLKMEVTEKILNDKPYIIEIQLASGLRIDELADRLEIRRYKVKDGVTLDEPQFYICLRPEVKEESQNDLWIEAINIFNKRANIQDGRYDVMKQFKITRI